MELSIALPKNGADHYIYLVISETPSKFGKMIRRFARITYNHASIAFDEDLKQLYSFGRRQNKVPLDAGLVLEYPERFSLRKASRVNVRIYKIPVSQRQYLAGKQRLREIAHDPEGYLYNLYSVLSFPLLRGFQTYKAYSCAEFSAHLLRHMNVLTDTWKPEYTYTPEEIADSIGLDVYFEGNLLDFCLAGTTRTGFFEPPRYSKAVGITFYVLFSLLYRKIRYRNSKALTPE